MPRALASRLPCITSGSRDSELHALHDFSLMTGSFQYPFDFAIQTELLFSNYYTSPANKTLLHYLQHFAHGSERLCYLWGNKGSGKTHLLQALCQDSDRAVYIPLNQMLAYGPHTLDGLETLDTIVLDDLQTIAGHSVWEEKLLELFNAVQVSGGHLCFAAPKQPTQLPLQLADLRSRLQLCVSFEVVENDDAAKAEIMRSRAEQRGIEIKEDVMHYIMLRNSRNLHDLMTILDKLDTSSLAEQRRITIPFVKEIMNW
jgi:DnaA-homolog protein